ncbi:hypothetical protein WJX81_000066 [Elliptochloris bilobata]|uniref:Uncharacterized protein n=1 Tax=Elliptochloris bilobata TaxID=381761 RepID=A0AAW1R1H7_9CHLO
MLRVVREPGTAEANAVMVVCMGVDVVSCFLDECRAQPADVRSDDDAAIVTLGLRQRSRTSKQGVRLHQACAALHNLAAW